MRAFLAAVDRQDRERARLALAISGASQDGKFYAKLARLLESP